MIWAIINGVLALIANARLATLGHLPSSPIYLDATSHANIATVAGYVAWFFPISQMVTELGAVMIAVSTLMVLYILWKVYGAISIATSL